MTRRRIIGGSRALRDTLADQDALQAALALAAGLSDMRRR